MTLDELSELVNKVKNYDMTSINERITYLEWVCISTDDNELHKELQLLKDFKLAYEIFNSLEIREDTKRNNY